MTDLGVIHFVIRVIESNVIKEKERDEETKCDDEIGRSQKKRENILCTSVLV